MSIIANFNSCNLDGYANNNYCFIIDDTAFFADATLNFRLLSKLAPILKNKKKKLCLPYGALVQLKNKTNTSKFIHFAQSLDNILTYYMNSGILSSCGAKSDSGEPNELVAELTKKTLKNNILFITANDNLAHDVNNINNNKSQNHRKRIDVLWLGSGNTNKFQNSQYSAHSPSASSPKVSISTKMTGIPNTILNINQLPSAGSKVLSGDGQQIGLQTAIASGGEGIVYQTDVPGMVAKIYKANKLTSRQQAKIELMVKNPLHRKNICYPEQALYNNQHQFVGYLMPKAEGRMLNCVLLGPARKKYFPGWDKKDLVQLCRTILKNIHSLHANNVILGDINPQNILVVSPTEVYFVDCDSYQYGEFPCPVGTESFTAPEIQHRRYDSFMRTMEHENFSIAILVFLILMNGKHPYSQQEGSNPLSNIASGQFPYCCGEIHSKNLPVGNWRYIWSNLPKYIKQDFYNVFQAGGANYSPNKRFCELDWINKMTFYYNMLTSGRYPDPQMMEIEPTREKQVPDAIKNQYQ